MSSNNIIAQGIEDLGARTFSTFEMAFNLIGLLHPAILSASIKEPIWADLNGGLGLVSDLNKRSSEIRHHLLEQSEARRAIADELFMDLKVLHGPSTTQRQQVTPRANLKFNFPNLTDSPNMSHLRGMLDLDKVVVATGFGEVG
jgi:fatty acid synthase subunit alpha, fungi type